MERLLAPLPGGVVVRSLADAPDYPEVVEDGDTFAANALIKARAAARHTGCWAIADDSGLEVAYLGGGPGVHSARYCGRHGDDAANNRLLLNNMAGVPESLRCARFVAAVAIAGPDGREAVSEGECGGQIAHAERGEGGFGYDSLFLRAELGKTMAELEPHEKDALSHRAKAFEEARGLLWRMMGVEIDPVR